jgi:hypothetical protein
MQEDMNMTDVEWSAGISLFYAGYMLTQVSLVCRGLLSASTDYVSYPVPSSCPSTSRESSFLS